MQREREVGFNVENKTVNPESLQATFKRLELQDAQKQQTPLEKDDPGACGYAKKDPSLILGRLCELQSRTYCENWSKPELLATCPALKKHGLLPEQSFK